jgi:hypothetical protein
MKSAKLAWVVLQMLAIFFDAADILSRQPSQDAALDHVLLVKGEIDASRIVQKCQDRMEPIFRGHGRSQRSRVLVFRDIGVMSQPRQLSGNSFRRQHEIDASLAMAASGMLSNFAVVGS